MELNCTLKSTYADQIKVTEMYFAYAGRGSITIQPEWYKPVSNVTVRLPGACRERDSRQLGGLSLYEY